jgi:putative glutamine amidotransferase
MTVTHADIPANVRGIVIGGGDDIDPKHYGLTGDAGANYDPGRDAMEMEMVRCALSSKIPILGICRGAQLINIVMGGNLHTDIRPLRKKTSNRNTLFPTKTAVLDSASKLRSLVRADTLKINSLHHQAMDRVEPAMRAVGCDLDGFTQAIESVDQRFILGVQWHPEYLPYLANQRKLFKAFAEAVNSTRNTLVPLANA